jgi:hypothetical protein
LAFISGSLSSSEFRLTMFSCSGAPTTTAGFFSTNWVCRLRSSEATWGSAPACWLYLWVIWSIPEFYSLVKLICVCSLALPFASVYVRVVSPFSVA